MRFQTVCLLMEIDKLCLGYSLAKAKLAVRRIDVY